MRTNNLRRNGFESYLFVYLWSCYHNEKGYVHVLNEGELQDLIPYLPNLDVFIYIFIESDGSLLTKLEIQSFDKMGRDSSITPVDKDINAKIVRVPHIRSIGAS